MNELEGSIMPLQEQTRTVGAERDAPFCGEDCTDQWGGPLEATHQSADREIQQDRSRGVQEIAVSFETIIIIMLIMIIIMMIIIMIMTIIKMIWIEIMSVMIIVMITILKYILQMKHRLECVGKNCVYKVPLECFDYAMHRRVWFRPYAK